MREQEGSRTQPFQEASIEIFFMILTASIKLGVGIYVRSFPVVCGIKLKARTIYRKCFKTGHVVLCVNLWWWVASCSVPWTTCCVK